MARRYLAGALSVCLTSSAFAAQGPGTTGSPFLSVPISGRAAALAGTLGGVTGSIDNLDYNPAAIAGVDRFDALLTHVFYLRDTALQAVSIGFPVDVMHKQRQQEILQGAEFPPGQLAVGLQYRQFKADDTSRSALLGTKGDEFSIDSQLFELALAYPITSRLGIGASAKIINDKVATKTAHSNAGDVGLTAKLSSKWTVAAAVQNLGSAGKFETASDPLPRRTRASASYKNGDVLALADVSLGGDGVVRSAAGLEWSLGPIIRLRAGAYHDTDIEFTGGLGVRLHGPQKAAPTSMRPPAATKIGRASGSPLTLIAKSMIERSAAKLMKTAIESQQLTSPSPLAIYPLNSKDTSGVLVSDGYEEWFKKSKDFSVLGSANRDHSDTMLVGNIEDKGDTLLVNVRLLIADTADSIASDRFEIAKEDLFAAAKPTLSTINDRKAPAPAGFGSSTLDLGLDYGISTHKDLDWTHTISIKLLY